MTPKGIPTRADKPSVNLVKKQGKGEWSPATIHHIITGEVYRGTWYYAKNSANPIEVDVPAIIDEDLWLAAQRKRKSHKGGRVKVKYNKTCSLRVKKRLKQV